MPIASVFIAMSHWSVLGLWLLSHFQYWILTRETHLGYFVVVLCHGDPAALVLQDWPHQMLQQFIDGLDDGLGNSKFNI